METNKNIIKNNGISLIVLVITIIVIIILTTAIIVTLIGNNPVEQAKKARIEKDIESMQAIFVNTVAKIMANNQSTIDIKAGALNTVVSGVNSTIGEVSYILSNQINSNILNGMIIFDSKENEENKYYTGIKLPIYDKDTIWYVDEEGIISLEVGKKKYGNGKIVHKIIINANLELDNNAFIKDKGKININIDSVDEIEYVKINGEIIEVTKEKDRIYIGQKIITKNGEYNIEVKTKVGGIENKILNVTTLDDIDSNIIINSKIEESTNYIKDKVTIIIEVDSKENIDYVKVNDEKLNVKLINGKYIVEKEVNQNGQYKIEAVSISGKINKKIVTVTQIEIINNNINIVGNVKEKEGRLKDSATINAYITYSGIINNININGENIPVPSKVSGKYTISKEVSKNGEYIIEAIAKDGTKNKIKIIVDKIKTISETLAQLKTQYVQNGLICWYDGLYNTRNGHSNTTNTWEDLTGNNNTGILMNVNKTAQSGWNYDSLILDGIDDWVKMTHLYSNNMTIEIVAKPLKLEENKQQAFLLNHEAGGLGIQKVNGNIETQICINGKYETIASSSITVGKKYSLSTGNNSSQIYIRNNGSTLTKKVTGNITKPSGNTVFAIGTNPSQSYEALGSKEARFNIQVYSVRIYNRCLTNNEIMKNYEIDKTLFDIKN